FNWLIGSAIIVNTDFDFKWSYLPNAFLGSGFGPGDATCGRPTMTEGRLNFDGLDYETFPSELELDQFFGEGTPDSRPDVSFANQIYFMSTSPGSTPIQIIGFNNNEKRFSRTFNFSCWICTTLGAITGSATQSALKSGGNPDELEGVATGWLRVIPPQCRE